MPPGRRTLVGAGLTAVGVAGALAAGQAVLGRRGVADEVAPALGVAELGEGVVERRIATSDGADLRVLVAEPRGADPSTTAPPTVVLLHGITLAADIWAEQLRTLPTHGLRVVAPDLRGHGGSTRGRGGLRFGRLADDVGTVIDAVGPGPVVLVGHSMGGMAALQFLGRRRSNAVAQAAGARVGALALVATSARPAAGRGIPGALAVVAALRPAVGALARLSAVLPGPSLPDSVAGDQLARLVFGDDPDPACVELTRRVTARVPARVSVELLAQLLSFDMTSSLGALALPTTVVVGDGDLMTPVAHAEALAAAIPDAELDVLPGCGHMVMLERPNELNGDILELVGRSRP